MFKFYMESYGLPAIVTERLWYDISYIIGKNIWVGIFVNFIVQIDNKSSNVRNIRVIWTIIKLKKFI